MELLAANQLLNYARRNRLRILMYHSISDTPGDRLAVRAELFAASMRYLAELGFQVLSLEQACALLRSNGDLRKNIVLTFDDGYDDFLTTAVPVLKEYGFHATLFVVPGALEDARHQAWRPAHPLLSRDRVGEVKAMGFSLGSHTLSHPDLTTLRADWLTRELCESRAALESWGEKFLALAYPGGRFTRRERDAVQQAGYYCAAIVGGRWGNGAETDSFLLKREPMLASDTLDRFTQRVSGFYEFHYLWAFARGIQTR